MAIDSLNDDQLAALSDEDLEARVEAERNDALADEPEVDEDVDLDEEPSEIEDPQDDEDENDSSESDDEVVDVTEDPSEDPQDTPDVDPAESEDETDPVTTTAPKFRSVRIGGKEVAINSEDELYALASAGGQFTQKMQEISQYKKSMALMQQNNLSESDLSLLVEARNGDKNALAMLLKESGVDSMDLEDEPDAGYSPGAFIPSDTSMGVMEVQREISADPEYRQTEHIVNDLMDQGSQDMLVQNPHMIRGIHMDVKNGVYETVAAEANKIKMLDGGRRNDMDYYVHAAKLLAQQNAQPQAQPQVEEPVATQPSRNTARRKAAGSSKPKVQPKRVIDFDEMDDDELMKYREQVMSRV